VKNKDKYYSRSKPQRRMGNLGKKGKNQSYSRSKPKEK
jgi:hypothetical protein